MTIGKNLLEMSADDLKTFVATRRELRTTHAAEATTKRKRAKSVASIAKELGVSKQTVLEVLEETK